MIASADVLGDRYRLVSLLGRGGMSDVWRAVDEQGGMAVAVKIVRSGDPEFARRLIQEARALERVEHDGLVRLMDAGVSDGQVYLVMELVGGRSLADALGRGRLGPARTAALGVALAQALAYIHAQGIVHRDVKPANVLLASDGTVKLADFGVARLLDASVITVAGTTLGTAAYMAPEQLEDHDVEASADVWSLGIVLLECLIGRPVYEGSPSEVVARRLAGPVPIPANLPVAWRLVLTGMLDHRPDERLEASEVAELLAAATFQAPWHPDDRPRSDGAGASVSPDLASLAAAASPTATAVFSEGATRVARPARPSDTGRAPARRWQLATLCMGLVAAALIGLLLANGSSPSSDRPGRSSGLHHAAARSSAASSRSSAGTTSTPSARTPTTTGASTTTVAPTTSGPAALAALVRDISSGVTAGSVDPGMGQAISNQAQQAISDEAAGKPNQAANDLQQAAMTIANGVQSQKISQSQGSRLEADLTTLATTLGLSAASQAPPTPPGPPGPHGHGQDQGQGHGQGHGR